MVTPADLRHGFAASDQRPRIGLRAGARLDGHRFAGKHRLVEQHFSPVESHVRRDHAAERELHHVPGHQIGGGDGLPGTIAPDGRVQREPRFEGGEGRLRAAFLEQSESRVEHQEAGDDRRLDIFAERHLKQDRPFKHPWNRRPELFER
jgi:hypothetical protein